MKKFAICVLAALMLMTSLAGCGSPAAEPTGEPSASPGASAEPMADYDWDAAYAKYSPDTVVMTIDGEEVTWAEYFYWLHDQYVRYGNGSELGTVVYEEDGTTFEEFLADDVEYICLQYHVVNTQAAGNGITLTDEDEAALDELLQSDITEYAGEDGTEEQMYERLAEMYITPELYNFINRIAALYPRMFLTLYGENGSLVSDEDTLAFAEQYGFVTAKHILFLTTGDDGSELSDAEKEARLSEARDTLNELNAAPEADRAALFDELMNELSEDPGLASFPDGYTYEGGAGIMVDEFDNAVLALQPGQISDIVESSNGYHIIMREPVTPDALTLLEDGQVFSLRYICAVQQMNDRMTGWMRDAEIVYTDEFDGFLPGSLFE